MMTGDASKETVITSVRCGANDYMIKNNFNKRDIVDKIKRLVSTAPSRRDHRPDLARANGYPATVNTADQHTSESHPSPQIQSVPWTQPLSEIQDDDERLQHILDAWE
jgi:DNA-binding response OmpR family regulator